MQFKTTTTTTTTMGTNKSLTTWSTLFSVSFHLIVRRTRKTSLQVASIISSSSSSYPSRGSSSSSSPNFLLLFSYSRQQTRGRPGQTRATYKLKGFLTSTSVRPSLPRPLVTTNVDWIGLERQLAACVFSPPPPQIRIEQCLQICSLSVAFYLPVIWMGITSNILISIFAHLYAPQTFPAHHPN